MSGPRSPADRVAGWPPWRRELHRVIFEHDTRAGKLFDVVLIATILVSVIVVMLDSVPAMRAEHGPAFRAGEWVFTLLFTVEYALRLASAPSARGYAGSFFGVIDLLAVLPTYASLLLPGGQYLIVIRILRLVRIFRVLKLARFVGSERVLLTALRGSLHKISVFLVAVLTIVVTVGAIMHLIEGPAAGFDSIPRSVYWAVVTLTTVGYGDIAPQTPAGQVLAGLLMILGYGIIAVPTGIVTVEMATASGRGLEGRGVATSGGGLPTGGRRRRPSAPRNEHRHPAGAACPVCGRRGHDADAVHCKYCGAFLGG